MHADKTERTYLDEAFTWLFQRLAAEFSQRDLAEVTGLNKTRIQNLLAGSKAWHVSDAAVMAEACEVTFTAACRAAEAMAEVLVELPQLAEAAEAGGDDAESEGVDDGAA